MAVAPIYTSYTSYTSYINYIHYTLFLSKQLTQLLLSCLIHVLSTVSHGKPTQEFLPTGQDPVGTFGVYFDNDWYPVVISTCPEHHF